MTEGKVIYQEKCVIEAKNNEGKLYSREISFTVGELSRKEVSGKKIIALETEFKNGLKIEKETLAVSDLKYVRDYFLKKLTAAIDLVHPEKRVKITFPQGNKYLKMRRAYCQNCHKRIKEFYGFYEGRVEKCPHCARPTVLKRTQ
ncbi:MAG: hypothetical protein COV72_07205 [Candidatus Omnitrophica bacterium CG11_big_fil_rev_8_21_14_0_20_42_13]|uniref:Uncharacterized protein n=1 Tax=Candidatus Ghiorseimicrobium undicola TaxID=1974746 RepID=A0A2H0LWD2_9BACT|nr:MAG: hypothetical protein COV72_07205 [Candidatus Omnitrophica bacterium CG11_big_fil_rev_8_21_14_0_20_42_13]